MKMLIGGEYTEVGFWSYFKFYILSRAMLFGGMYLLALILVGTGLL